jgi:S-adenosylmethionine hydrolase
MIVTLTTDFGEGSSYVAAMKGALLAVNPAVSLVDLSHRLPPQGLVATAYFLSDALPYFPAGTIHVVVVDPGVGTDRALLGVAWAGQVILAPDNGCWTPLTRRSPEPPRVYRLDQPRYWRPTVSATFHGRDILAPAAGHLSRGVGIEEIGSDCPEWVELRLPEPVLAGDVVRGLVVFVDRFGNLVTNIPAGAVRPGAEVHLPGGGRPRLVRTYGEAEPGTPVALIGSNGRLEVAVVNGSAAGQFGLTAGAAVEVRRPR